MSVIELKQKMHNQIDNLTDARDIEELYETMNFFFGRKFENFDTNTANIIQKIENSHKNLHKNTGISTSVLKEKMQEWLSK